MNNFTLIALASACGACIGIVAMAVISILISARIEVNRRRREIRKAKEEWAKGLGCDHGDDHFCTVAQLREMAERRAAAEEKLKQSFEEAARKMKPAVRKAKSKRPPASPALRRHRSKVAKKQKRNHGRFA